MSIKVWEAYRLKRGHNLWEVLRDIRLKAEKIAKKTLTGYYDELIERWKKDPKAWAAAMTPIYGAEMVQKMLNQKRDLNYLTVGTFVARQYRAQKASSERHPFDLDVCVAVRHLHGRYYVIPYPGSGLLGATLRFLRRHPMLEDFHYQNQSDRPRNISAQEWARRRDVWNVLLDDDRWPDKLVLDIVTPEGFSQVDPWIEQMRKAMKKRRRS